MEKIIRKRIAFDPKQLKDFDKLADKKGYKNRSEAIRDLIRDALVKQGTENPDKVIMGTLTMVYTHHDHDVQHILTHVQHDSPNMIISSLHTHKLPGSHCSQKQGQGDEKTRRKHPLDKRRQARFNKTVRFLYLFSQNYHYHD